MQNTQIILILIIITGLSLADTLVLKNGLTFQGTFKGGTEKSIKFETSGQVQEIAVAEIKSLTFGEQQKPGAPGGLVLPISSTGAVSSGEKTEVLPAGTKLMIRTQEAIGTGTHQKGDRIQAKLEKNIEIGRRIAAPRGSVVYGRILESTGTRKADVKRLLIAFDQIVIDERLVDIQTDDIGLEAADDGTIKTIGSGSMMTAAIGGPNNVSLIGETKTAAAGKQVQIPEKVLLVVALKKEVRLKP